MRFYQGLLPAIIWDPKSQKPLVSFKNGILDTDDEKIIKRLKQDGYLVEKDLAILEATGTLPHGGFERVPNDRALPGGFPMDEPERFGGRPNPKIEEEPVGTTPAGNIQGAAPPQIPGAVHPGVKTVEQQTAEGPKKIGTKRPRKTAETKTSKKSSTKKTSGTKKSSTKSTSAKKTTRTIKRRDKK